MSPPPFRNLAKRIIICSTLLPLIALSQVTIKEKVEIQPKAPAKVALKSDRQGPTVAGSDRFFNPQLFVHNPS